MNDLVLVVSLIGLASLVSCAWLVAIGVRSGVVRGRDEIALALAPSAPGWWVLPGSVATVVGAALLWQRLELAVPYQVRLGLVIVSLGPLAVVDRREHVGPNRALIALRAGRAVIYAWEAVTMGSRFGDMLRAELVTAAIIAAFFGTLSLVGRGGIGMGDVKLFGVLTLYLGTQLALASILASLLVAFLVAVTALATRRLTRKDSFAMVPSIAAGTVLAVVLVSIRGVL